ncbi:hypothetical protein ACTI_65680 [Actinoplanes sp. OR16]|nr:hypothetical protein ACTI_65680 [Actinoplanes sp. OR16]
MAAAAASGLVMLEIAQDVDTEVERAKLQIEAIKTALTVGVGTGGAIALFLSGRKQWLSEKEHEVNLEDVSEARHDAVERRVTELYAKASELLGQDAAVSKMAGMYALVRLGDAYLPHRQTIVDLLCGYLRLGRSAGEPIGEIGLRDVSPDVLETRMTAQRLLASRLRASAEVHWSRMRIDLSGAILHDLDLSGCRLERLDCRSGVFVGPVDFTGLRATEADFRGAAFRDDANFAAADFGEYVRFDESSFAGETRFDLVELQKGASFAQVSFGAAVGFSGAKAGGGLDFYRSNFKDQVVFRRAKLATYATFDGSIFEEYVTFLDATCGYVVRMIGVTFNDFVDLGDDVPIELFGSRQKFNEAEDATRSNCTPRGWRLEPPSEGYRTFALDKPGERNR